VTWLLVYGIGIWGVNIPIAWGLAITNFVWWIGIGHAGTLISAILLLLKQRVRTSINRFAEAMTIFAVAQAGLKIVIASAKRLIEVRTRFAEAMTIFAVAQAGLFPLLHLGRPYFF